MTAQIIPFGDWPLCECGAGIAAVPVSGGFCCDDCAERLRVEQACESAASIMLKDPGPATTLDSLLRKLVES